MLSGSPFYCARATILGHISPINGVPSCLSGCWLTPICDCLGVWYVVLGHISLWAFLSELRYEFRGRFTFLRLDIHIN